MHGISILVYGGMFYCLWRVSTQAQQYTADDVFTVMLYLRKYGLVVSRLGGDLIRIGSVPGSATQFMSLG